MKLFKLPLVLGILLTTSTAFAQSAEEVISKHLTAIGGADTWKKINTMKMSGSITAQGMEIPVTMTTVNKKGFRLDLTIMDANNYQIVTDKEGWMFFPIQGQQKPEPMTADDVKEMQDQLDIQGELVDYKTKGSKVEFLGKDDMEGTEVLKIKLIEKSGKEKTMFFDAGNYYKLKESQKLKANGKEMEVATTFSNFKKLPEGITVPFTIESPNGPVTLKSVEVNPKVEDKIFKPAL
ncbi:MAG: hypothetical protein JST52_07085 [Bacteroidetes bacterium]|nr:hypothetical protein [Bacteroidota bacterium]MBS1740953.1 hypothetical protein [Bacteroidota bacterium]MBS1774957.1 hypothetical protein [Bacteroidota bacterium]